MLLHFRTLVTFLIFETFGTPYLVLTEGLGRRHSNRSVATIFAIVKPAPTPKPPTKGRDIASKLFIFDTSKDNLESTKLESTESASTELESTDNKPRVYKEPRESLNERHERIRLQKLDLENQGFIDFDGSGIRARGGLWEERRKKRHALFTKLSGSKEGRNS